MMEPNNIKKLEDQISRSELRAKHLSNELRVTKQEYEDSTNNYFELLSSLEKKVRYRTSELNDAKRVLEVKSQELQIMLDLSPTMICYKDMDHRYIRVNKKFAEFLGISVKQVIGKTHADLFTTDTGKILHDDSEVFETGEPALNKTGIIQTSVGQKSILIDKIPYKDENEKVISIIAFIQDLTELEKAEKEKKELQERITRAEKMEAIGLLAGGFAHDCNNILGGIMGNVEIALMNISKDNQNRKYLTASLESVEKLAQLVQDLLTLARRGVIKTKVLNLNDMVSSFLQSSIFQKIEAHNSGIKINIDLESNLMNIVGKQVHLDKTVMNLVANAAEALPDGGTITISTKNQYVDIPINGYDLSINEGEYVVLKVSDDGTGIAPEDMNRIFEPFYSTKIMGKSGTGLGMSVVYGTVKDHQGFIDVRSIEGVGTTFKLFFPITREEVVHQKTVLPMKTYMGNGQKVLIIDDAKIQREIASDILTQLGYCVSTVASGEEAIDYVKNNPADILVLDMIMPPGIDGLDTYRKILEFQPLQKAIIASGFSECDRVKECERLGAGQYIPKPYTFEKIGMAIKNELSRSFPAVN